MRTSPALRRLIAARTATVAVVGQGYVGLSVAAAAAAEGMTVHAIDVDAHRIAGLAAGTQRRARRVRRRRSSAASTAGGCTSPPTPPRSREAEVVLVCVPTPVVEHRPDLSFIEGAGRAVAPHLQAGSLVDPRVDDLPRHHRARPAAAARGERPAWPAGTSCWPTRPSASTRATRSTGCATPRGSSAGMDAGRDRGSPPRSTGSSSTRSTALSSCRAAEMAKLLENTFRMVNIALVNELATLCADQGIDVWEVIDAAATKPFGFMPFQPGPGVGGHCIPLDPTYLAWQSRRDTGKPFRLVELAQDINAQMPTYVAARIVEALNEHGKSIKGARILALGVTYKPDVGDIRESAAIEVLAKLAKKGADVSFHDPFVEADRQPRPQAAAHRPDRRRRCRAPTASCVLTPHSAYDVHGIAEQAALVFDARNAIGRRHSGTVVTL